MTRSDTHMHETRPEKPASRQREPKQSSPHSAELLSPWAGNPFGLMRRFSEEMDRLFGDFFSDRSVGRSFLGEHAGRGVGGPASEWVPSTEVFERQPGQLVVRMDLPGLGKDDIDIELTEDALTVTGERRDEREETHDGGRYSERRYGRFSRRIPLPEGVTGDVRASFENGVLEITIPVPETRQQARHIEIQEGRVAGASEKPDKADKPPARFS